MRDLKQLLNPDDQDLLSAIPGTSWVPKEPSQVLLPYKEEEDVDRDSLDYRREKSKEVVDGYSKIINQCKDLEAIIESRCKDVKIPLERKNNLTAITAMTRVFGPNTIEITFEHYKKCIEALAEINNQMPKPGK